MRVFFAVEFPKEIKEMLMNVENKLKDNSISGNFTTEENLHLTIKFIGEITPEGLEKLKECLDKAIINIRAFKIRVAQLGEFSRGQSKLIWTGIEDKDKGLINVFNSIENEIEAAGYKKEERSFRPHITLGREVKLKERFNYKDIEFNGQDMIVDKIAIMESNRIKGKLIYTPIYHSHF
jgi:2'-5' RNA ligase